MGKRFHTGFLVDDLGRIIRQAVNRGAINDGADPVVLQHGWMIGYINHEKEEGRMVFQKEMEKIFHMPKSTLGDTLSLFEKKGLIEKVPVKDDGRCKQIVVTEKGEAFSQTVENQIDQVENYIKQGITEDEMKTFMEVLEKMKNNAISYHAEVIESKN